MGYGAEYLHLEITSSIIVHKAVGIWCGRLSLPLAALQSFLNLRLEKSLHFLGLVDQDQGVGEMEDARWRDQAGNWRGIMN